MGAGELPISGIPLKPGKTDISLQKASNMKEIWDECGVNIFNAGMFATTSEMNLVVLFAYARDNLFMTSPKFMAATALFSSLLLVSFGFMTKNIQEARKKYSKLIAPTNG